MCVSKLDRSGQKEKLETRSGTRRLQRAPSVRRGSDRRHVRNVILLGTALRQPCAGILRVKYARAHGWLSVQSSVPHSAAAYGLRKQTACKRVVQPLLLVHSSARKLRSHACQGLGHPMCTSQPTCNQGASQRPPERSLGVPQRPYGHYSAQRRLSRPGGCGGDTLQGVWGICPQTPRHL